MKNSKARPTNQRHAIQPAQDLKYKVLSFVAVISAFLLAGIPAQAAPVNLLYFPLTNSPGTTFPSSPVLGGVSVNLTAYNGSGASANLAGPTNAGVNGGVAGVGALTLTNGETGNATQSANANAAANSAADLGDATLAFGNITSFIVRMWIKEPIVYSDATGNTLPREVLVGKKLRRLLLLS